MDPPSTLKPAQVAAWMVDAAVAKHRTRLDLVLYKSVLAGVMLSFGGLLSQIISGGSAGIGATNPGLVKIMGGFVFPVGLVMIVLQGFELLTSNMMVFPMAVIKGAVPWWSMILNWTIVTFGNLAGSLFFAAVLAKDAGVISTPPYSTYAATFAFHKAHDPTFRQIFIRGIACNWLVSVAVWQAAGSRDTISKIISIWIPIWIFVACGYDHVVANMFSIPLGIMMGADLTTAQYIRKSLIAAWLGNLVGALLVGLPATYFYLSRHTPIPGTRRWFPASEDGQDGLRGVEEGEAHAGPALAGRPVVGGGGASGSESGSEPREKSWERRREAVEGRRL